MKKITLPTAGIFCGLLTHGDAVVASEPKTLCEASEQPVFFCHVGEKILSVCSSKISDPASGLLTYRFGKSQSQVELKFPSAPGDARKNFKFIWLGGGHWAGRQLSFSIDQYTYTVISYGDGLREWQDFSGVAVAQNGKSAAFRSCSQPRAEIDKLYLYQDAGLLEAEYSYATPPKRKK
jgi:hypothetical protein